MVQAFHFLASWQLFPEKGTYELGERPLSGMYKIRGDDETKTLHIYHSWVTLQNEAFEASYSIVADGKLHPFEKPELADHAQVFFPDSFCFEIHFYKKGEAVLHVIHEILPNGYLKITQQGQDEYGNTYTNTEIYHKQLSVLPYASSVAGAVIRPTEEGLIRHKALLAMEEQTQMQLEQIRKQVELLAQQAREIQKRKELSVMIYNASVAFKPVIGHTYYLYQKEDDSFLLSMISPEQWGKKIPYKRFVAAVRLLADHTWQEV
ncbi:MAG: DUF2452 domain-containing protein [Chitinophagaceae bacterium]|nr:DUF2452 domain-containing protein [Chitinophagaceae bacterium]